MSAPEIKNLDMTPPTLEEVDALMLGLKAGEQLVVTHSLINSHLQTRHDQDAFAICENDDQQSMFSSALKFALINPEVTRVSVESILTHTEGPTMYTYHLRAAELLSVLDPNLEHAKALLSTADLDKPRKTVQMATNLFYAVAEMAKAKQTHFSEEGSINALSKYWETVSKLPTKICQEIVPAVLTRTLALPQIEHDDFPWQSIAKAVIETTSQPDNKNNITTIWQFFSQAPDNIINLSVGREKNRLKLDLLFPNWNRQPKLSVANLHHLKNCIIKLSEERAITLLPDTLQFVLNLQMRFAQELNTMSSIRENFDGDVSQAQIKDLLQLVSDVFIHRPSRVNNKLASDNASTMLATLAIMNTRLGSGFPLRNTADLEPAQKTRDLLVKIASYLKPASISEVSIPEGIYATTWFDTIHSVSPNYWLEAKNPEESTSPRWVDHVKRHTQQRDRGAVLTHIAKILYQENETEFVIQVLSQDQLSWLQSLKDVEAGTKIIKTIKELLPSYLSENIYKKMQDAIEKEFEEALKTDNQEDMSQILQQLFSKNSATRAWVEQNPFVEDLDKKQYIALASQAIAKALDQITKSKKQGWGYFMTIDDLLESNSLINSRIFIENNKDRIPTWLKAGMQGGGLQRMSHLESHWVSYHEIDNPLVIVTGINTGYLTPSMDYLTSAIKQLSRSDIDDNKRFIKKAVVQALQNETANKDANNREENLAKFASLLMRNQLMTASIKKHFPKTS